MLQMFIDRQNTESQFMITCQLISSLVAWIIIDYLVLFVCRILRSGSVSQRPGREYLMVNMACLLLPEAF